MESELFLVHVDLDDVGFSSQPLSPSTNGLEQGRLSMVLQEKVRWIP